MADRLSKIAGKSRYSTLEMVGRVMISDYSRIVETDAAALEMWGWQIAATNEAARVRDYTELLRCSNPGCKHPFQHFTDFDKSKAYPWRADGRAYYCKSCMAERRQRMKAGKLQGVVIDAADETYLRSKPNNRRIPKKIDVRAATA